MVGVEGLVHLVADEEPRLPRHRAFDLARQPVAEGRQPASRLDRQLALRAGQPVGGEAGRLGAGPVSLIGTLGPVVTLFLGWLILAEPIGVYQLVGGALVIAGVLLVGSKR